MSNRSKSIGRDIKHQPKPAAATQKPSLPKAAAVATNVRTVTPQIQTYDTINEAVHEYLLKSGLFRSVDTFRVLLAI